MVQPIQLAHTAHCNRKICLHFAPVITVVAYSLNSLLRGLRTLDISYKHFKTLLKTYRPMFWLAGTL